MTTDAGIVASGLRRSFADVQAVRDVTLDARPGRVTALVGPNGSGKTTLLLMLASLLQPDAGQIRLAGVDPATDPAGARALLGWMPDTLGAWPSLTARETLVVTARLYRIGRAEASARAHALLTEVGLTDLADAPARVLSRGQKQRLGLARALVHDPRVLLLDEPASGLDPQARIDLRRLLRRLADDGRTILVSSHILAELEEVADDAVFLVRGETVAADRIAAASRSGRAWRIRLLGSETADAAAVETVRAALPAVAATDVTADRRDIRLLLPSEAAAGEALAALVRAGVPVVEFAPASGDLEQTFLELEAADPGGPQPRIRKDEAAT